MAFDDEDPTPLSPAAPVVASTDGDDAVIEDGDDVQDFRQFASSLANLQKGYVSKQTVRRGEKDFESHGTRLQAGALEASRNAMHDVLSYERVHKLQDSLKGWYFPDRWAEQMEEEHGEAEYFMKERVVALETEKGPIIKSTGRVLKGIKKEDRKPGWNKLWLLPEEALYLVERGDMQLWWPTKSIEEIFLVKQDEEVAEDEEKELDMTSIEHAGREDKDYDLGVPLSFQAAYSIFIGSEGERGKVTLEQYQVYANLRRSGYLVQRAGRASEEQQQVAIAPQTLWEWLFSILTRPTATRPRHYPAVGPLVRPGLYRSYQPIYEQLNLIPRHQPTPDTSASLPAQAPFKVFFHVFKPGSAFTKAHLPPPDFRIAVVDTVTTTLPTLTEISALLDSTPYDPPPPKTGPGIGHVYKRLKHGWRNVIIAVVDRGMISYLRFAEIAFGEEKLFEGFDVGTKAGRKRGRGSRGGRGGKRGGRGG